MAAGLIALLDDIATLADDVATLSAAAAKKTSGIVTDDMAVTAEQAIGILTHREIPVVVAVAKGSAINKCLYLAPGALLLNAIAPWAITPILMAGGTYLAYEGVEKVIHRLMPHDDAAHHEEIVHPVDPVAFEKERVSGAIRTDFILSGEIIAITLGEVAAAPFVTQVATLYIISIVMTVGVYGMVAGLIKMDDLGAWLVLRGGAQAGLGRMIVAAAPRVLHLISQIGTVAMLMVGGHILLEGIHPLYEVVHHLLEPIHGILGFLAGSAIDIAIGGVAGLIVVGIFATGIPQRIWGALRGMWPATT